MERTNTFKVGGIFGAAGAGLLAAQLAGYAPAYNIEPRDFVDYKAFKSNFPGALLYRDFETVRSIRQKFPKSFNAHIIVGSPDCKKFSNLWTRNRTPNDHLQWHQYGLGQAVYWISLLKPTHFILENLPGALKLFDFQDGKFTYKGHPVLSLNKYHIEKHIIDSQYYGVPQKRKRLFIIGSTKKLRAYEPLTCHKKLPDFLYDLPINWTVKGAISQMNSLIGLNGHELPSHSQERIKGFEDLPPGESFYGTQNNRRLYEDLPSWTVASHCSQFVHPKEPRVITPREAARLMGFPDRFKLGGTRNQQYDQVGKSVIPHIVYHIIKHIIRQSTSNLVESFFEHGEH